MFETGDERYRWLNAVQAVGTSQPNGLAVARYDWYELRSSGSRKSQAAAGLTLIDNLESLVDLRQVRDVLALECRAIDHFDLGLGFQEEDGRTFIQLIGHIMSTTSNRAIDTWRIARTLSLVPAADTPGPRGPGGEAQTAPRRASSEHGRPK